MFYNTVIIDNQEVIEIPDYYTSLNYINDNSIDKQVIIKSNDIIRYYFNKILHRDNAPAVINTHNGDKDYYVHGVKHRLDGPATDHHFEKEWFVNGVRHRLDGPASILSYAEYYYVNGKIHRDNDEPAILYKDGAREWFKEGKRHRDNDKPAMVLANGDQYYYINDKRHRENGPAVIAANGTHLEYLKNNVHHREDGPAIKYSNGDSFYYIHGKLHNENGPASIYANGQQEYYKLDKLHNKNGPAIIRPNGHVEFYIDGEFKSEKNKYGKAFYAGHIKNRTFNNSRLVGVEWEFNEASNEFYLKKWKDTWRGELHEDGSCGREAITAPIAGDNIEKCLTELGQALNNDHATVNDSCSVHVHVDLKDYTWQNLYSLMSLYARFEPLLYLIGGSQRADNDYCYPIGKEFKLALNGKSSREIQANIIAHIYGYSQSRNKDALKYYKECTTRDKKRDGRYVGMNILPWISGRKYKVEDKTVEFRIHEQTLDINRVINWTKLLVSLVSFAKNNEFKKLPVSDIKALQMIAPECKNYIAKLTRNNSYNVFIDRRGKVTFS